LETYLLGSQVQRGNLDRLRRLWADIGPRVKAGHRGETFTDAVLAGRIPRMDSDNPTLISWAPFGRLCCDEHATAVHTSPIGGDLG
jgi:hypothetical protein